METTPSRSTYGSPTDYAHLPLRSSPLASPGSSPAASASARRRTQYKSNPFNSSAPQRVRESEAQRRRASGTYGYPKGEASSSSAVPTEEAPRKAFLRERLKARCIERAVKKRERALAKGSRHLSSEGSSDGVDEMMDEDDEDEDSMLNDEVCGAFPSMIGETVADYLVTMQLFHRIVESAKHKQRHAYRLSYAYDVGSSFDPAIDDVQDWEEALHAPTANGFVTPDDLSDEELEAYAAEAELSLDDLPADEIFSFSDLEDEQSMDQDQDVDMH
ncbi:hypothetical protein ACG7TL_001412 [Trametes sanguinea]